MVSRDIVKCVPFLVTKYFEHHKACLLRGVQILLTCTGREEVEQVALYAQGREILLAVNRKRAAAGMPPITEAQNKHCVTWTMDSKHIIRKGRPLAEAYDIVIVKAGAAIWDIKADIDKDGIPDYLEVAAVGREIGLRCGADFKDSKGRPNPDYPHFEVPLNYPKGVV